MKTLKKLTNAFMLLWVVSFISVGCGNNNKSGGNTNTPIPTPIETGNFGSQSNLPVVNLLRQLFPCQRINVSLPIQMQNFNSGATFVGSTSEGDIAIAVNAPGGAVLQMEVCQRNGLERNGLTSSPILSEQPVLNNSLVCPVGEIVSTVKIPIQGTQKAYELRFHAEYLKQLCGQNTMF